MYATSPHRLHQDSGCKDFCFQEKKEISLAVAIEFQISLVFSMVTNQKAKISQKWVIGVGPVIP